MKKEDEDFIAELPSHRKPHLRLFFSADIAGSTAYKQRNLQSPDEWFNAILTFYRQAEETFSRTWEQYKGSASSDPGRQKRFFGNDPELWKTVGDEVLFTKKIDSPAQVISATLAWISTLFELRELLKKRNLDVKSSAWLADFPIRNSEVVLKKEINSSDDDYQHIFDNDKSLKAFYESAGSYTRDFIGPSIDTGFRLGAYASPRKFAISVELAYMLSSEQGVIDRHDHHLGAFGLRQLVFGYDGRASLKGVMNGNGYPVFWIDLAHSVKIYEMEDELLGNHRCDISHISHFSHLFIAENSAFLDFPYIISQEGNPASEDFSIMPDKDIEWLKKREELFRAIKERESMDIGNENPSRTESSISLKNELSVDIIIPGND